MSDSPLPEPTSASVSSAARPSLGIGVWLALGIAGVALVGTGVMWQRLSWTQQELSRRAAEVAVQSQEARQAVKQSAVELQSLQAKLTLAEVKLTEVSLQRTQLEELMLSLSRSRDDNLVLDLEASVRLAHQQADFTGSPQPLMAALQAVAQRIERASQPRLNPVLRAVERDLEKLRAAPSTDLPAVLHRLDTAGQRIDYLPVANDALRPAVALNPNAAADANTPLWQRWWADIVAQGRALVRVSRIDRPEASLLAPEQAYFLRGNVRLLLLNARVGILSRQTATARSDVQKALNLLERFFDQQNDEVRNLQHALNDLLEHLGDLALPRPDDTLTALATAAAGR
jgi:uroporphyrin-3 C-methyltransferase